MSAAAAWGLTVALWAGCLLAGPWWLAPGGLGLLVLVRVATGVRPLRGRRWAALALAAIALAATGAGQAGGRASLRDGGILPVLASTGGAAELRATVVTEPRPSGDGAWLLVRVTRVDGEDTRERALVQVDDLAQAPAMGERLALTATARPLPSDGFGVYLRRLHAGVALDLRRMEVAGPPGRVLALTNAVRDRTRGAFSRHLDSDRAALLAGLTVGDTHGRSPERAEQFAAASLTHLVVVSGRHVALMLAGVLGLTALLGVGARGRRRLGLAAVVWYAVLVRWQPSVLRAGVMAGLVLAAGMLGRGRDPRHVLAMAVLLLLLADPMLAGQVGFALSVLATAGVLVAAPWLAERLPGPRPLRLAAAVTLGAQAGAAPILLGWLDGVPLGSVPANLVAVPAAAMAQTVGMVAALCAQISTTAGAAVAVLAAPALSVVLWTAEAFSTGPVLRLAHLATPTAVLLVTAVLVRRRRPALAAGALVLVLATVVWPTLRPTPGVHRLTVTAFDVGQGDALLVEVPGDPPARLLYDGGPAPRTALAQLRRRGVRRLDAAVLSHPHEDHVVGLPAVLASLDVGALLVGPLPLQAHGEHLAPAVAQAYTTARQAGVPVVPLSAGRRFTLGDAVVEVLSPPGDGALGEDHNANSVVLRVTTGDGRVLLTGDAEETAQRRLLHDPRRLRAEVVQVPHHGGNTNADGFFDAVGAEAAVLSVGVDNDHGHPHPQVLADLAAAGSRVARTDQDGTVVVTLPSSGRRGAGPARPPGSIDADGGPTGDLPADRPGRAVAPPGRRARPGRASGRDGRAGRRRRACRGPRRAGTARPADRLSVRHPPRRARPRGPGAPRRRVGGPARRARRDPAGGNGDPAGVGDRSDPEARHAHQGARWPGRRGPAARLEDRGVGASRRR